MRARMYDPRLGRFQQVDPVQANRASDHYQYGANNPITRTDPLGLDVTPEDWRTYNSMMGRLAVARSAGGVEQYNMIWNNLLFFTREVMRGQSWYEFKDQETARTLYRSALAIPDLAPPNEAEARRDLATLCASSEVFREQVESLETAREAIKWTDRAATIAGLATGVGALAQAGRAVLMQGGKAALAKWAAKEGAYLAGSYALGESGLIDEVENRIYAEADIGPDQKEVMARLIAVLRAIAQKKTGSAKWLGGNPFKGKTPKEIDAMLRAKGYIPHGPDPVGGKGAYINPRTGRSYHIDIGNRFSESPHIDVSRSPSYRGDLEKRKYHLEDD